MQTVRLVPGEFPQQSLWSYYVDYYRIRIGVISRRSRQEDSVDEQALHPVGRLGRQRAQPIHAPGIIPRHVGHHAWRGFSTGS